MLDFWCTTTKISNSNCNSWGIILGPKAEQPTRLCCSICLSQQQSYGSVLLSTSSKRGKGFFDFYSNRLESTVSICESYNLFFHILFEPFFLVLTAYLSFCISTERHTLLWDCPCITKTYHTAPIRVQHKHPHNTHNRRLFSADTICHFPVALLPV